MAVFKINKTDNFTMIPNSLLQDKRLSNKALGLIVKMLSLPPNWNYSIKGLIAICKDGQSSIMSSLQELKDCGYLTIKPIRENGRIVRWEYLIYDDIKLNKDKADEDLKANTLEESCVGDIEIENNSSDTQTKAEEDLERKKTQEKYTKFNEDAKEILAYLNELTHSRFREVKSNLNLITSLLKQGFTKDEIKKVIHFKNRCWGKDNKMKEYLRPTTLFGGNFESYLNAAEHSTFHHRDAVEAHKLLEKECERLNIEGCATFE